MDLKIFVKNGALYAQETGQPEFPFTHIDKDRFTFDQAHLKMIFLPEGETLKLLQIAVNLFIGGRCEK